MMEGSGERDAVSSRKESRRVSSPKAVAARWSRDSKQNRTLEDWRRSTLGIARMQYDTKKIRHSEVM
jgi:hypothetical protein